MSVHQRLTESPPRRRSEERPGAFDGIVRGLVLCSARKAPPMLSERLAEEWLADLSARNTPVSKLQFALGCCWATVVIAHELGTPVRTSAAVASNKTVVVDSNSVPSFFSRRSMVVLLIVGLHVLVIYGFTITVANTVFETVPRRMDVVFLPTPSPPTQQPPSSKPNPIHLRRPIPEVRPPDPPSAPPVTTPVSIPQPPPLESSPPSAPQPVSRIPGGPGAGFPNTNDFYPEAARRLGEKGVATVNVCVNGVGQLTATPTIEQSSGSARLDAGALKLAKAGSGHYRPTTEDGRPVSACYAFRVRFDLKD